MKKEEWMYMIQDMGNFHSFARQMLKQKSLTLTCAQMEMMLIIFMNENRISSVEACNALGMKKAAVSRLTRGLAERGFLKKTKSSQDERKVYLELTDEGNNELNENYKEILGPFYALKEELGNCEYLKLIELVKKADEILRNQVQA